SQGSDAASAFKDETTIQMSDFSSAEIRQILIELQVDPASAKETEPDQAKNLSLGVLQIRFGRTEESPIEEIEIPLSILVDDDETRRDATNNAFAESIEKVAAEVMSAEANEAQDRAMQELEAGRVAEARNILQYQQAQVMNYQQQMPMAMRASPQYQAIGQQQQRMQSTMDQLGAAQNNQQVRRNLVLSNMQQSNQMAQGFYSSSNQAQFSANAINASYAPPPQPIRQTVPSVSSSNPWVQPGQLQQYGGPPPGQLQFGQQQLPFGPQNSTFNPFSNQMQMNHTTPPQQQPPQFQSQQFVFPPQNIQPPILPKPKQSSPPPPLNPGQRRLTPPAPKTSSHSPPPAPQPDNGSNQN
ncbi:MAG: hypothetical protein EZS28_016650, partial [Streblomastix strix]